MHDSSLTKASGVTLTQSYISLELKGSEEDVVHICEVCKSAVLGCQPCSPYATGTFFIVMHSPCLQTPFL